VKKLRCWLGFHHWVRRVNDEGKPYRECTTCGKYREPPDEYLRDIGSAGGP
jgi:hypothetical protein